MRFVALSEPADILRVSMINVSGCVVCAFVQEKHSVRCCSLHRLGVGICSLEELGLVAGKLLSDQSAEVRLAIGTRARNFVKNQASRNRSQTKVEAWL